MPDGRHRYLRDMKSQKGLLKEFIQEILLEMQKLRVMDTTARDEEYKAVQKEKQQDSDRKHPDDKINTPQKQFNLSSDIEQRSLEDQIELAMADQENQSLDARIDYAIETGDTEFTTADVQAIARNMAAQMPDLADLDLERLKYMRSFVELVRRIRLTLINDWGMKFIERKRVDHSRRGSSSPAHGRHPFADSGGGGSGMGSDRSGPVGFGMGGGPGTMKGGDTWDANNPRNLPMGGAKRRPK